MVYLKNQKDNKHLKLCAKREAHTMLKSACSYRLKLTSYKNNKIVKEVMNKQSVESVWEDNDFRLFAVNL
jgi:hypothetical protein